VLVVSLIRFTVGLVDLTRLRVYLHCPIFLAMLTCLTKSGLTVSWCGEVSVVWFQRFLSGTCKRLSGLRHVNVGVVRLI
jgi:ABC-type spermidine/putrescine transport system permease subunit II